MKLIPTGGEKVLTYRELQQRCEQLEAQRVALLVELRRIVWEPQGRSDATHREVLNAVVDIAAAAIAAAEREESHEQ